MDGSAPPLEAAAGAASGNESELRARLARAKETIAELVSEIKFLESDGQVKNRKLVVVCLLLAKIHHACFEAVRALRAHNTALEGGSQAAEAAALGAASAVAVQRVLTLQSEARAQLAAHGLGMVLDARRGAALDMPIPTAPDAETQRALLEARQNAAEANRSASRLEAKLEGMRQAGAAATMDHDAQVASLRDELAAARAETDKLRSELKLKDARIGALDGDLRAESAAHAETRMRFTSQLDKANAAAEDAAAEASAARSAGAGGSADLEKALRDLDAARAETATMATKLKAVKAEKRKVAADAATALREVEAQVQALAGAVAQSQNPAMLAAAKQALEVVAAHSPVRDRSGSASSAASAASGASREA